MTAGKLSKLRALSRRERGVLIQAALLLPLTGIALHAVSLRRVQRWLGGPPLASRPDALSPRKLAAFVGAAAAHLPFRSSCLARSLLLEWLLRREGISSELRIGVRIVDARLDAHAWVECGGEPVNASAEMALRYSPFEGRLSPAALAKR